MYPMREWIRNEKEFKLKDNMVTWQRCIKKKEIEMSWIRCENKFKMRRSLKWENNGHKKEFDTIKLTQEGVWRSFKQVKIEWEGVRREKEYQTRRSLMRQNTMQEGAQKQKLQLHVN